MEETAFDRFLLEEVRTLLSELEAGNQPSNIVLHEKVVNELFRQFERR